MTKIVKVLLMPEFLLTLIVILFFARAYDSSKKGNNALHF